MESQIWSKKFQFVFLLLLYLSLTSCNKNISSDLIVFDINGNFPVKTLDIEDIADIEYLILDISDDDFLFRSFSSMTDSFIICRGDNEYLFFSRSTGKPVSKVNRLGQGPGEYTSVGPSVYSEINDELFINSFFEIYVYTRDGTFKRKFPIGSVNTFFIGGLYDFDKEHLLIKVTSFIKGGMRDTSFMLVSKQNGFMDVITIPIEEWISTVWVEGGGGGTLSDIYFAVRNGNDFLLTDYSSDTVYRFTPDRQLIPVLVRKPSIQKMETKIFLHGCLETGKYLFFSTQTRVDLNTSLKMAPHKGYLMDKNSREFFQTYIKMRDYNGKELILNSSAINHCSNPQTGIIVLDAYELQAANNEGKLSGKLKEATDRLSKDDEKIFMILHFK